MTPHRLLLLGSLILFGASAPAAAQEPSRDAIGEAWRVRAAVAAKRLAGSRLDACDRALETAFQHAEESASGDHRMFLLRIEVGRKAMLVTYEYEKGQLQSFAIASLPARWFVTQVPGSKTVTVLLSAENCALDLCADDPLANGPCPSKPAR